MNQQMQRLRRSLIVIPILNGVLFMALLGIAIDGHGWQSRAAVFPALGFAINFAIWLFATRQVRGVFRPNETESQSSRET